MGRLRDGRGEDGGGDAAGDVEEGRGALEALGGQVDAERGLTEDLRDGREELAHVQQERGDRGDEGDDEEHPRDAGELPRRCLHGAIEHGHRVPSGHSHAPSNPSRRLTASTDGVRYTYAVRPTRTGSYTLRSERPNERRRSEA